MSKSLTVSGNTYLFPENRQSPVWGEDATAWAEAVTDVLESLSGTGSILQSSATIGNNVSSATNINGFAFDPTTVRGAVCDFVIYRIAVDGVTTTERCETGQLFITYKSAANTWELVQVGAGSSGVTFSISAAGQIKYTSDSMAASTSYSGSIKFQARALTQ